MADLLTTFANAYRYNPNSAFEGAQNMQNMMTNALDYQQKREALEAQRSIKELYAQNPQPGFEDIARIDPAFAMQQQIANMNMREKMLKSEKTQGEISEQQKTAFARTAAPIAEKYAGMQMNPQTMAQFHQEMGGALSQFEQQTGIKPPPGFNVEALSPDSVLMWAAPYYQSPTMANRAAVERQSAMNQLPPQMTPNQAFGYYNPTEYGIQRVPGMGGTGGQANMPQGPVLRQQGVTPFAPSGVQQEAYTTEGAMPRGMQPAEMTNVAEDIAKMKAVRAQMPAGRQRNEMDKLIADLEAGNVGQPSAPAGDQFVTGQDIQRAKEEARKKDIEMQAEGAGLRKTAETGAERLAEGQRITDAFKRAIGEGGVSRVMKLISESTSGPTEAFAANVVSGIPRPGGSKSTSGMENIGALRTIAGELRKTIERSPGPQSDKDVALAALDAAGIADPNIPYNERMRGFLEFTRIIKERAETLGLDPKAIGIDVDVSTGSNIPTAKTDAEADELVKTLRPGQSFIGPDGKTHTIRGR